MGAKKELSLLPDSENINTLKGRLVRWLTSVGRVVIILTELIVVSAFLSRFYLDRVNSDLSERLRQQKSILESTKAFEQEFNMLQNRLTYIKSDSSGDVPISDRLITLTKSIPKEVTLNSLRVENIDAPISSVSISAIAPQQENIVDFITNISLNPQISSVEISKIEKKTKNNQFLIDLTLQLIDLKNNTQL